MCEERQKAKHFIPVIISFQDNFLQVNRIRAEKENESFTVNGVENYSFTFSAEG